MSNVLTDAVVGSIAARFDQNAQATADLIKQAVKDQELEYRQRRTDYVSTIRKQLREAKAQDPVDNDEVSWLQAELNSLKG
jgi:hypothetical protein